MIKSEDVNEISSSHDYDRALTLMQNHAQVVWKVFGTFLLAEAVILGFIGTGLANIDSSDSGASSAWLFGGSVFGLLLIIPWWSIFSYTHAQYLLSVNQARRHENDKTSVGKLLTQGKELSDKGKVFVNGEAIILGFLAKKLPPHSAYKLLMSMFALAFEIMAVAAWRI